MRLVDMGSLAAAHLERDDKEPQGAYRALLVESRKRQLRATSDNVKRMETIFDTAAASLAEKVAAATEGSLAQAFSYGLLRDMDANLSALRTDFATLLNVGMVEAAQIAADREAQAALIVGAAADGGLAVSMTTSLTLSGGNVVQASFGRVALSAVERTASRVWSDGWKLSDRLYNLDAVTRQTVQNTLVQGVAEQISAREMGKRLEGALASAGADNPRYQAMRIARTEINTAHREAHVLSTIDPRTGGLKEHIQAVGWRLSLSHKGADICDVWSSDDGDGLGAGNYLPGNVPGGHPHCLCYTTTVLKAFPEVSAPGKDADAGGVAESQARYYAEAGDATARRWLEKRGKAI